ncbi:oxygen-insensitive NADPH nitroreductase [Jeotgalibacillus proteolyticus]|uniref:Oxygen-insensitive NADPH nitroreductase n=1 Tax=Jeotgalibacillus proteolyticus TaxID=2082395 RepID=A0A2S5GHS3_9BACL|nr:oxygen-insensitive NADPH nitroreductase [Jeotgalibacillus proteolyticus]PPA72461.1 oxygen-insensitive NADPH nitroreductase [Jeotgalibacillus proteolyticus]
MKKTIETLMNHRSVRKFKDVELTKSQIKTIVSAAQMASTSSFIQAYTIIGVTDKEKKKKLAALAGGQEYVAESGHLFIFCADLYRHSLIGEWENADVTPSIESTEKFMVTLIDAALAAQNAAIAAESMGLGICYIGGIRNELNEVNKIIDAPDYVLPLFGLTVGVPDQHTEVKPRMPFSMVYHENTYQKEPELLKRNLDEYNQQLSAYYDKRTQGLRNDGWSDQMAKMLQRKSRMYMKEFVEGKKLNRH